MVIEWIIFIYILIGLIFHFELIKGNKHSLVLHIVTFIIDVLFWFIILLLFESKIFKKKDGNNNP